MPPCKRCILNGASYNCKFCSIELCYNCMEYMNDLFPWTKANVRGRFGIQFYDSRCWNCSERQRILTKIDLWLHANRTAVVDFDN